LLASAMTRKHEERKGCDPNLHDEDIAILEQIWDELAELERATEVAEGDDQYAYPHSLEEKSGLLSTGTLLFCFIAQIKSRFTPTPCVGTEADCSHAEQGDGRGFGDGGKCQYHRVEIISRVEIRLSSIRCKFVYIVTTCRKQIAAIVEGQAAKTTYSTGKGSSSSIRREFIDGALKAGIIKDE
jgi:hypothetical protein